MSEACRRLLQDALRSWDMAGDAQETVAESGIVVADRHGMPTPSPLVRVARDSMQSCQRLLCEAFAANARKRGKPRRKVPRQLTPGQMLCLKSDGGWADRFESEEAARAAWFANREDPFFWAPLDPDNREFSPGWRPWGYLGFELKPKMLPDESVADALKRLDLLTPAEREGGADA
ncbi:MAG: hypothetical protein V3T83_16445 [Acidobacteriota bacterium]